jgi:MYXO-CTERM domain-containing protein
MAYTLNDRRWEKEYPSEESFELNGESFPAEIVDAYALEELYSLGLHIWNTQSEAVLHLPYGDLNEDTQYGDGNNDHNTTLFIENYDGTSLAKARHNAIDGALTDCDIAFYGENINGVIPWSFEPEGALDGTYDFAHTVVHELGHCIGLGHSEYEEAVMYSSSTKGSGWEKRNLHEDDQAAVQALYGDSDIRLSIDSWWIEDSNNNQVLEPGEAAELFVKLRNEGDAHAYAILGVLAAAHPALIWATTITELGDLGPQETTGTISDNLRFPFIVHEDCLPSAPIPFEIIAEDAVENQLKLQGSISPRCSPSLTNGTSELTGCGCRATPSSPRSLWLIGLGLFARRRKLLK